MKKRLKECFCTIIIFGSIFIPYYLKVRDSIVFLSFAAGILIIVIWNQGLFKSIFVSARGLKVELNDAIEKVNVTLDEFLNIVKPIIEYNVANMEDLRWVDTDITIQNGINLFKSSIDFLNKHDLFDKKSKALAEHAKYNLMGKLLRSLSNDIEEIRPDFYKWTSSLAYESIEKEIDVSDNFVKGVKKFDGITEGFSKEEKDKFNERLSRINDFIDDSKI